MKQLQENLKKIHMHGMRTDTIINEMMLHSRSAHFAAEPVNLNQLCEDYLNVAYNSFRAKHLNFKCEVVKKFNSEIGRVILVNQNIGRVLVNLLNNAFYSMKEKNKTQSNAYQPMLTMKTEKTGNHYAIKIIDNGIGIADGLKEKIFTPFFTTKPTGEAIGLGLSMSYEIIKAHNWEINFLSVNDLTEFKISIPV